MTDPTNTQLSADSIRQVSQLIRDTTEIAQQQLDRLILLGKVSDKTNSVVCAFINEVEKDSLSIERTTSAMKRKSNPEYANIWCRTMGQLFD